MAQSYHFCFQITKISLLDEIQKNLDFFTSFKCQLFHSKPFNYEGHFFKGKTNNILCTLNKSNEIIVQNEQIKMILEKKTLEQKQFTEIRLIEVLQNNQQKLIGCYQFVAENYIKACNQLNRHCVEIAIQIGENFILQYDVFVEKSALALKKIIKEHKDAKKLSINHNNNQEDEDFLPEEITEEQLFSSFHELKSKNAELISPRRRRYWSPKRKRLEKLENNKRRDSFETSHQILPATSTSFSFQNKNILKLKKWQSEIVDINVEDLLDTIKINHEITEAIQLSSNNSQDHNNDQNNVQLYNVIQEDSTIMIPGKDDSYILYKGNDHVQEHSKVKENKRPIASRVSLKKYILWFIIVLAMVLVLLFPFKSQKRQIKHKKIRRKITKLKGKLKK